MSIPRIIGYLWLRLFAVLLLAFMTLEGTFTLPPPETQAAIVISMAEFLR
jgi:hypothetical protein